MRSLVPLLLVCMLSLSAIGDDDSWLTRSGYYRLSYESELDPIVINRIHRWIIRVETPDGVPVSGAVISVEGGMPLHNHGLPTEPRMTRELDDGAYVVEGMRFHMNGDWELSITVDVAGRRDTVVIPLTL